MLNNQKNYHPITKVILIFFFIFILFFFTILLTEISRYLSLNKC